MFADPVFATQVAEHLRERIREKHAIHVANISLARQLGLKIAKGTDAGTPGNHFGDNLRELEVMVKEAGFSTLEAIRAATLDAAATMRVDDELGSLDVGKRADIVAVETNPLDDVSALRFIPFVMKDGRIVKNELRTAEKDS